MLNPNTGTLPVFRTRRDADITLACYRRHPVLIRDGDADGTLGPALRHAVPHGERRGLFRTADDLAGRGRRPSTAGPGNRGDRTLAAAVRGQDAQPLEPPLLHLRGRHPGPAQRRLAPPH